MPRVASFEFGVRSSEWAVDGKEIARDLRKGHERIITQVGVEIGAVTPEEITISIVAQIIQQRRSAQNKPEVPSIEAPLTIEY